MIEIARCGEAGLPDANRVLESARLAQSLYDRPLLALCLDCFRSIVGDSKGPEVCAVIEFIGELLEDPDFIGMRLLTLKTLGDTLSPLSSILGKIELARGRPRNNPVRRYQRSILIDGAYEALNSEVAKYRLHGLEVFERMGKWGGINLQQCLKEHPDHPNRIAIETTIKRLAKRQPGSQ